MDTKKKNLEDGEPVNLAVRATAELQAEIDKELEEDDPALNTALAVLKKVDDEQ